MRVLSLFSGVGGLCSLGLGAAGHDVVGLCEIDAKARSVLRRHHPDTPIWEDVTTLDGKSLYGRVDLVAGGSPCQDLSVAGRRAGLDGARSGLFWHQCRCPDTDRMTFVPVMSFAWMAGIGNVTDPIGGPCHTLIKSQHPAVAISENQRGEIIQTDYAHQLSTGGGKPGQGYPAIAIQNTVIGRSDTAGPQGSGHGTPDGPMFTLDRADAHAVSTPDLAVRRLTPRECERLMGWPDDHTRWADDGTEIADSHRYRMCGNGVVAPVAEWIGRRLPTEVAA